MVIMCTGVLGIMVLAEAVEADEAVLETPEALEIRVVRQAQLRLIASLLRLVHRIQ